MPLTLTLADVDRLAAEAHRDQFDKIGVPYIEHVRAVSAGLAPFGVGLRMAGLLHDVLEDTAVTVEDLARAGVPSSVIQLVQAVTMQNFDGYASMLDAVAGNYGAALIKISDNAHNSHPERLARLPEDKRARLAAKYHAARGVLWPAVALEDVRAIVERVNPSLLPDANGPQR
ncbi:HD domain-containing protein [Streptacidiphilus anmyonensis]|uniref:HD domain-containing protein n=1 Tax=Streptacidiphilus anmyonensis TaxID=405782 RepID=UPI0005A9E323|nr:HD domain-containing protein [Streptacidiphilus anmyonensis]